MLGLDSSGRTSALYMLKFGEFMNTIPTIGFNVETIEYKRKSITFWDVGGCDKIRPLWRHYFANTQAVVFCINFLDDRFEENTNRTDSSLHELSEILKQPELESCILSVWITKYDDPDNILMQNKLKYMTHKLTAAIDSHGPRIFNILPLSAKERPNELWDAMDWIEANVAPAEKCEIPNPPNEPNKMMRTEEDIEQSLLEEWLSREDDEDEVFLQKLNDYSLTSWDHRTHLRAAWLLLEMHGREKGMPIIFESIRNFIANSNRTARARGTTFHETMTYFWVHMVDFARQSSLASSGVPLSGAESDSPSPFKLFLLMNPQLSNGGLFLHYYSKKLILQTASSRTQVVLPDMNPLPSMLTPVGPLLRAVEESGKRVEDYIAPAAPLTDDSWLQQFESKTLLSWGHNERIRLLYLRLSRLNREDALDQLFRELKEFEKQGHHVSIVYFWISYVTLCITKVNGDDAMTFDEFASKPSSQCLKNPDLIDKYYTLSLIDSERARNEFAIPDKKQIPSYIL